MRKRHKKSEMPFAEALEFAKKRLSHAQKELEQAQKVVRERVEEIPTLQQTVDALERQLNPSKIGQPTNISYPTQVMHFNSQTKELTPPSAVVTEPTEDELLPEPEGLELTPES